MAEPITRRQGGFSLVEMLVAMVFTLVLMAGMATVFRGTFSNFVTAGEKSANARRNRMSINLLYDDLNNAGMYLTNPGFSPSFYQSNEAFFVLPNPTVITGVTQGADELYFYMDEPLPFEGSLSAANPRNQAELANSAAAATTSDGSLTIDCKDASYVSQVAVGQTVIFRDYWETASIKKVTPSGSTSVVVETGSDANVNLTGIGATGVGLKYPHMNNTGMVFVRRAQQVRYSIKALQLDPLAAGATVLCLVRDQGDYNPTGFNPTQPQQVITENVTGFRVYLSANSGSTWVGGSGAADWGAMKAALNTQLTTSGRPGFTSVTNDLNWFRTTPVLVRIDVTTRTAAQRSEYSATGSGPATFKEQVQSLVLVPRHFGLALN